MEITALSLDLALTHAGMSLLHIPVKTGLIKPSEVKISKIKLVKTERKTTKGIYQNSDDLRRLSEIVTEIRELQKDADVVFAEIPSGAQNARAATTFGAVLGILSTLEKPLIQVQKNDRGMIVAGRKVVSKTEVIDWAHKNWPELDWETTKRKGSEVLTLANEHVADSIAVAFAGMQKEQWQNLAKTLLIGR